MMTDKEIKELLVSLPIVNVDPITNPESDEYWLHLFEKPFGGDYELIYLNPIFFPDGRKARMAIYNNTIYITEAI